MGTLRLLLALGVVFGHSWHGVLHARGLEADPAWWLNLVADRAVLFFYIISGFLMSYVLHEKYPPTGNGTRAFFRARFLRIYPLWWAVLALCLIVNTPPMPRLPELSSVFLFGTDWIVSFAAYPLRYWNHLPYPTGVAWTLGAELTFYVMAPWVLRSWRAAMALFAMSFAIRLAVPFLMSKTDFAYLTWMYCFFPSTLMFFLLGHFAYMAARVRPVGVLASLGALALAAVFSELSDNPLLIVDGPLSYASCLFFAAALPGLFAATKDNPFHNYLGDLTYPLYLTHEVTLAAIFWPWGFVPAAFPNGLFTVALSFANPQLGAFFMMAVIFCLTLGVAVVAHYTVERPARKLFEAILARIRLSSASAPAAAT